MQGKVFCFLSLIGGQMKNTAFESYLNPEQAGVSSKVLKGFLDAAAKARDKV